MIEFQINKINFGYLKQNFKLTYNQNLVVIDREKLFGIRIGMLLLISMLATDNTSYRRLSKVFTRRTNSIHSSFDSYINNRYVSKWFTILQKIKFRKKIKNKKKKIKRLTKRSIRPTNDILKSLDLKSGRNTIKFSVTSKLQGNQVIKAKIYLWPYDKKIVISDVDGTITKSDVLGHLLPWVGSHWSHNGVAEFYTSITKNGYNILYLTSRAICQAESTRQYLFEMVEQHNSNLDPMSFILPEGPVIMAPDSLLGAFHRELIQKKPQVIY